MVKSAAQAGFMNFLGESAEATKWSVHSAGGGHSQVSSLAAFTMSTDSRQFQIGAAPACFRGRALRPAFQAPGHQDMAIELTAQGDRRRTLRSLDWSWLRKEGEYVLDKRV